MKLLRPGNKIFLMTFIVYGSGLGVKMVGKLIFLALLNMNAYGFRLQYLNKTLKMQKTYLLQSRPY